MQSDSNIFKQTGPVLVKQDLEEAKASVANRIQYISTELKRQEKNIVELEKKREAHKEKLKLIQSRLPPPNQQQA